MPHAGSRRPCCWSSMQPSGSGASCTAAERRSPKVVRQLPAAASARRTSTTSWSKRKPNRRPSSTSSRACSASAPSSGLPVTVTPRPRVKSTSPSSRSARNARNTVFRLTPKLNPPGPGPGEGGHRAPPRRPRQPGGSSPRPARARSGAVSSRRRLMRNMVLLIIASSRNCSEPTADQTIGIRQRRAGAVRGVLAASAPASPAKRAGGRSDRACGRRSYRRDPRPGRSRTSQRANPPHRSGAGPPANDVVRTAAERNRAARRC